MACFVRRTPAPVQAPADDAQAQAPRAPARSAAAAPSRSGPCSSPVSARRSGRNSALPLRPVAALQRAGPGAPGGLVPGLGRQGRQRGAQEVALPLLQRRHDRAGAPPRHQGRASRSRSRLPRTASQKASSAPSGRRSRTASKGASCSTRRFSASSCRGSKRAGECETRPMSQARAPAPPACPAPGRPRCRARPGSPASAAGSIPSRRSCRSEMRAQALRQRRRHPRPSAAAGGRSAGAAALPPSAAHRSSWMPVLVTWSSPRTTCVTPLSRSSTTEVKV